MEVAGLVLAIIPLFISAAEHYKKGFGFVKTAINKESFATQYRDDLTYQRTLLGAYIQGVVGKTKLSAKIQKELVDQPLGEVWRTPDVVKQVSDQLGDAYQPFLSVMSRICRVLSKQIKVSSDTVFDEKHAGEEDVVRQLRDLCLEYNGGRSTKKATSKAQDCFERIKFSWKSKERKAILEELERCNSMLEKLRVGAENARPYARKQQTQRIHSVYEHRGEAHRLFEILQNNCKCQPGTSKARDVGLQLQVRKHKGDVEDESSFEMIFFLSRDVICQLSAKIARAIPLEPPKKKARISDASTIGQANSSASGNMKVLEDLCAEMVMAHACRSCLHLVVDEREKVYCTSQPPASGWSRSSARRSLSLAEVMSELKLHDRKRWLHREKAVLAIILAYSLLQLHDSPWSRAEWSSDDIIFVEVFEKPGRDVRVPLHRPYTRSGTPSSNTTLPCSKPGHSTRPTRRNGHLHALGVVLLELFLNRAIHEDVVASGTNDYRHVALDLLEEHADDMTMAPEYLQAVRFCLCPRPNESSGSFSFEDGGFRELFYEEVIMRLEDNLRSRFELEGISWMN